MKIFLIGYRCTGKTTIGKLLAHRLKLDFIDTDFLVEQIKGLNISQIVQNHGWKEFRKLEKQRLFSTKKNEDAVIATGGGIIIDPENQKFIMKAGFSVWLDADLEIILQRLNTDSKTCSSRPSLTNNDLFKETRELLCLRKPLYAQASHIRIDVNFHTPEKIVNIIERRLY